MSPHPCLKMCISRFAITAVAIIIAKMATKQDLETFKGQIEANTKRTVAEAVDPVKDAITILTEKVTKLEIDGTNAKNTISVNDPEILQKITDLEALNEIPQPNSHIQSRPHTYTHRHTHTHIYKHRNNHHPAHQLIRHSPESQLIQ